jgi:uncharacterized glyoxalase superfamily protein PhnB
MPTAVKRIPEGCHTVTPHLVVRGAAQAIEFYQKAFGARELGRHPGPSGKIMHAEVQIGDSRVHLNDEFPEMGSCAPPTLGGTPVVIHLWVEDVDAVFNRAVQAGAQVVMPVADMFWGDRYGLLQDPFGHRWSLASHLRDLTPEQIAAAGAGAMAAMGKDGH